MTWTCCYLTHTFGAVTAIGPRHVTVGGYAVCGQGRACYATAPDTRVCGLCIRSLMARHERDGRAVEVMG